MALTKPVNIIEVRQVTLASGSPDSPSELCLPLTFFDTIWFKFHPVERLFFFSLTDSDPTLFKSVILQKLKQSLSLALVHFLPLAGKLIWPPNVDVPFIKYTTNDGVSLTFADSNDDFNILSGFKPRKAIDSHHYVPELPVTDSEASVIALQITLFPNQGFCIGISSHHAILDGKSSVMFMKAWAHICKHLEEGTHQSLPPELTPYFDRTLIGDPDGYTMKFLNLWLGFTSQGTDSVSRSLKLILSSPPQPDLVRATFKLSREDIKKLRETVLSKLNKDSNEEQQLHLSTFVLTYAYTMVCILKSKGAESNTLVSFGFTGDCRSRLETPLPANYFGNCVTFAYASEEITTETYIKENGIDNAARRLSNLVKTLQMEIGEAQLQGMLEMFRKIFTHKDRHVLTEYVGVAGSPRFEVYGADFGWGRPKTVEITSVDRTSSFSLAESSDGRGGVEVGLALKEHQMEIFQSVFTSGLEDV